MREVESKSLDGTAKLCADLYPYYFTRDHNFHSAILLPVCRRQVIDHRSGLAKTLCGHVGLCQPLFDQIVAYRFRALLRKLLVNLIAANVVRVPLDSKCQAGVCQDNTRQFGQLFPSLRTQVILAKIEEHVPHVDNEPAWSVTGFQNAVELIEKLSA